MNQVSIMSVRHLLLSLLTLIVTLLSLSHGYHTGAPSGTCQSMLPQHNNTLPRTDPAPYQIDVSRTNYTSGQTVNVTIVCNSADWPMEGFLLIARRASNNQNVGTFTSIPSSGQSACEGTGVTHVSNTKLNSTNFIWTPASGAGDVYFIATVVRGWSRGFWTGLRSATVTGSASMLTPAATMFLVTALSFVLTTFFADLRHL